MTVNYYYQAEAAETAEARRERLILEQLPQVHLIARRLHERLPKSVCLEDLISTGIVGLISAIDNFSEAHGVKLKTYAEYKIRGAMLDSLRDLDWVSRNRRTKAKKLESAMASAQQRLRRAPTEDEVAAEMGISLAEYQSQLREVQGINLDSLGITVGANGNQTLLSLIPDSGDSLPSGVLERAELERLLAEAIEGMPETEKTVLALYYKEELTLREIGEIMGMHISRVSELKAHSILRLRTKLTKQWPTTRGR